MPAFFNGTGNYTSFARQLNYYGFNRLDAAKRQGDEPLVSVWKSKFHGAFVLNRPVVLHAIDAPPARWRGDAGSSSLDGASTAASSPRNDLVKNYG